MSDTLTGWSAAALRLAAVWHSGQTDRSGRPALRHVLRVIEAVPDGDARAVAALHDIVEDTPMTLDRLAEEFPPHIVAAVDAITRRETETYSEYIARLATNPLAREVKIADLRDNLSRDGTPQSLCARYRKALAALLPPE